VAVGDDWQSIFAFAGADITLFQKFLELMGHGVEMQIKHTYRNAQELIDIAGGFIQKNPTQIKKQLISPKRIKDPVEIVEYDGTTSVLKNWTKAIDECVERIVKEYGEKKSILLITRFNFEKDRLCESGYFSEGRGDILIWKKNPNVPITCLTAHSSKGLGFDNVIILNMKEATFGFPSQLEDDPVLKVVTAQDLSIPYAEERRLFYVALTRTKNKVFMVTPQNAPSRFVLELINDYQIKHSSNLSFEVLESNKPKCPMCKATLKYQANNPYGIPLYMCTNDPEICDFMTNNKQVLADIYKCPKCKDGYMIVKESRKNNDFFYGRTNYPICKNQQNISNEIKSKAIKTL
ncbi:MAG: DNA helicase UvrD, partial [Clostridiales bacterium]|nr:DNA helicase UvrD [Clostridiales bacterium]